MADIAVDTDVREILYNRGVRLGPIWIGVNTAYVFYTDSSDDLIYRKTTDGGATWGAEVTVRTGDVYCVSLWYDKWTPGISGTTIHIAYLDFVTLKTYYRSLDTFDDSLGTETAVFTGVGYSATNWSGYTVDILRSRGGNLYIGFWGGTAVADSGFYRSTDNGATWTSRAQLADGSGADGILLMPGDEDDNQDIWCIYWDRSADEISLKVYDDSGNSWSETSIATSMADSNFYYQMSASPRGRDNHVILAVWSELDAATADLKVWDIGGSGDITAMTSVVTDLAESAQVAVLINQQNDDIYVAYLKGGTWEATTDVVYRKSTDGGTTWSAEQSYSEAAADDNRALWAGVSVDGNGGRFQPMFFNDDLDDLFVNLVNSVYIAPSVLPLRDAYVEAAVDDIPNQGSARS